MKKTLSDYCTDYDINLSEDMLSQFEQYALLLLDWNSKINLTAVEDPDEINVKHFLDSLLLLKCIEARRAASFLDVGTGAGFPGVPVKIARPDLNVTLLDSLRKRLDFLAVLSDQLKQDNKLIHGRAEDYGRLEYYRESYDIVVARAVAPLRVLLELCMPFVKVGGVFLAMKGIKAQDETEESINALRQTGGDVMNSSNFTLPDGSSRRIITIKKITQISPKYPRKPGKISKTPL